MTTWGLAFEHNTSTEVPRGEQFRVLARNNNALRRDHLTTGCRIGWALCYP
jgi:hypothetical protein